MGDYSISRGELEDLIYSCGREIGCASSDSLLELAEMVCARIEDNPAQNNRSE